MPELDATQKIRIFISSPGDVADERDALEAVIKDDLQPMLGRHHNLYLEPLRWEDRVTPGMGDIQTNVFEQMGAYDIFVGIFWKRFGTPTREHESGSEAEFQHAYSLWEADKSRPILMYFCEKPASIDLNTDPEEAMEQLQQAQRVKAFREELESKGLYWTYHGLEEFKQAVTRHLYNTILRLLGEEAAEDRAPAPLDPAYKTYLSRLLKRCRLLPLGAFGYEHGAEDDVTLDEVYINLLTTARRRAPNVPGEGEFSVEEEVPVSALEAVEQTSRLVLLGDPGSGKSTFVNQLLADFAFGRLSNAALPAGLSRDLVPVRIILRRFANRLMAEDLDTLSGEERDHRLADLFVEQTMQDLDDEFKAPEAKPILRDAFREGTTLLALDGLDEIPSAYRERMQEAVRALINTYSPGYAIVTCRIRSYQEEEKHIQGFASFTLAPFNDDQKRAFVEAWYNTPHNRDHLGDEKAREKAENLSAAVSGPALGDLARNPMLLTTMAVIHQRDIGLPDQRARLYLLACDVLLRRWQTHRGSDVRVSDELKAFLADERRLLPAMYELAYRAHLGGKTREETDITRGDALALLESKVYLGSPKLAGEFLDYVDQRSGMLVGQGGGDGDAPLSYSFPHRTFQEYLAGCRIVSQQDVAEALIEHADQDDYWYVPVQLGLEEMLHNRRQDWPLLRLAYQLCPPDFPEANRAQQRLLLWAGVMAQLVTGPFIQSDTKTPGGGDAFFSRLQQHLIRLLSGALPPIERAEAGRILGRIGDQRAGVTTLEGMSFCYVPAGPFLMGDQGIEVDIPYAYWFGRYPVTNAQFEAFEEAGGYEDERWWTKAGWAYFKEDRSRAKVLHPFDLPNHPVVGVSWYEAHAFTEWLTAYVREQGWIDEDTVIRLPNEPEWEKAARGGLKILEDAIPAVVRELSVELEVRETENSEPGRVYPWGEAITPDACNYGETGIGTTSTPGCFPAGVSPNGVHDMSGNIWEWSRSKWEASYGKVDGDFRVFWEDPEGEKPRVLRGGSFGDNDNNVRCADRGGLIPGSPNDSGGFRLVALPSRRDGPGEP